VKPNKKNQLKVSLTEQTRFIEIFISYHGTAGQEAAIPGRGVAGRGQIIVRIEEISKFKGVFSPPRAD